MRHSDFSALGTRQYIRLNSKTACGLVCCCRARWRRGLNSVCHCSYLLFDIIVPLVVDSSGDVSATRG